jgi:hypothetical protein
MDGIPWLRDELRLRSDDGNTSGRAYAFICANSAGGDDADSIADRRGGRLVYVPAERDRILDDAYVHGELLDTGGRVHDQWDDAAGDDDGANFGDGASSGGGGRTFGSRRERAARRWWWRRSGSLVWCGGC